MTQIAQVLDVGGGSYTVPSTPVLNLAGGIVTVSNTVLDVDGNSFTVFYTQTTTPVSHMSSHIHSASADSHVHSATALTHVHKASTD